jgi:hypothetical protein
MIGMRHGGHDADVGDGMCSSRDVQKGREEKRFGSKEACSNSSTNSAEDGLPLGSVPSAKGAPDDVVLEEGNVADEFEQCALPLPFCQRLEVCITCNS